VPGALTASPTRVAYALDHEHVTDRGSDYVSTEAHVSSHLSIAGGPFSDPIGCDGAYVSTAVDGDTVGFAVNDRSPCGGIWIAGSPKRQINADGDARQLQIAGQYVAWLERPARDEHLTVADLATGAVVLDLVVPGEVFDIDERGNIVVVQGTKLLAFTVSDPHPRVIARNVWSISVATAAGRVAYVSYRGEQPDRLLLADLDGKVLRRLDRYTNARRPAGEIALTDRRVAWTVLRVRNPDLITGPGNVLTETL
jgi:hypothetical protein